MVSGTNELKGYRRYHGYDYSRGATLFVTIATAPRQMIFGRVVEDRVELNAFGLAAEETFLLETKRNPALNVMAHVIMPDHAHFTPQTSVPLQCALECAIITIRKDKLLKLLRGGGNGQLSFSLIR